MADEAEARAVVRQRAPAFGHAPTGRSHELVAMEWIEIEGGKIRRRWGARDALSQARRPGIPVQT